MKYTIEVISNKLKDLRIKSGKTQKEVADFLHITTKQISSYENKVLIPPIDTLLKYCELFNCELGYILGETDYSDKTKIDTMISNNLGLSLEAIEVIKKITGRTNNFMFSSYNHDFYKKTINEILTSDLFLLFIEHLIEVAEEYHDLGKQMDDLKKQLGDKLFSEAFNIYLHENPNEVSSQTLTEAINSIAFTDSLETEKKNNFIVQRYQLHVFSEKFIDSLYPIT